MKKRFWISIFCGLLAAVLLGCQVSQASPSTGGMQTQGQPGASGAATVPAADRYDTTFRYFPYNSEQEAEELGDYPDSFISQGEMIVTLSNARIVSRKEDIPEGSFYDKESLLYSERLKKYYFSSEIFEEDGTFVDDAQMILVDITYESLGAENESSLDSYGDLYLFNLFSEFIIFDPVGLEQYQQPIQRHNIYFASCYGEVEAPGAGFCFRLAPGEKRTITVGYVVSPYYADGTPRDMSGLCLLQGDPGVYGGDETKTVLIHLGLDGGEMYAQQYLLQPLPFK